MKRPKSDITRTPSYTVRTTQMSDEMYKYVESRIEGRTFKEYAFELIEREMYNQTILNRLDQLFNDLRQDFNEKITNLEKEISNKEFSYKDTKKQDSEEEKQDISEGQVVPENLEVQSTINPSEYDFDF